MPNKDLAPAVRRHYQELVRRRDRHAITCAWCGVQVENVPAFRKWCSVSCKQKAQRASARERLEALERQVAEANAARP